MIKWREVTWYSRWGGFIFLLALVPVLSFCVKAQREFAQDFLPQSAPLILTQRQPVLKQDELKRNSPKVLKESSLSSLRVLQIHDRGTTTIPSSYLTDGASVFFSVRGATSSPQVVVGADSKTFEALGGLGRWARDKDSFYNNGIQILEADTETFEIFCLGAFAKDKYGFYNRQGKRITTEEYVKLSQSWGGCSII